MARCSDDVSKSCELKQADRVAELSRQSQMTDEGPKLTASDAKLYINEVKERLTSEKYIEFHEILKDFREHRIDIPCVKTKLMKMFDGDKELLKGLNIFLPKDSKIILSQEDEPCDVVMQLVHNIKIGLQDDHHLYVSFLGILNLYRMRELSANEVHKKVVDLLQDHQNLIVEFTNFLPHCHANSIGSHNTYNEQPNSSLTRKRRLRSKEEAMPSHGETGGQPDGKLILGSKRSLVSRKHKNKAQPFQDLDLSNPERCNPSYRRVPRHSPIGEASQRTEMDKQVLNDDWVSVNCEREGQSFKPSLKNQYEKILFQLEDDRFELDMGLERIRVTIKEADELMRGIYDKSIKTNGVFPLEDYFPSASLRCIKIIYGDYGHHMLNELRKNVSFCLPIILMRMKQKEKEWMMFHSELNKLSGKIFVENHQLSLDHHGFYLEQQDAKTLCPTALLAEINEIRKVKSKGEKHDKLPHLNFKYSDINIQDDLFHLLKLHSAEICSSQQLDRVLKIWTNFVDSIFGIPPRPGSIDNINYIAKASQHTAKHGFNGVKEDQQIMISTELIDTNNYLEFMTNEIDSSPLVDLEKGGFAACMDDRTEADHTPKDVNEQDYHNTGRELGNEVNADNSHVFYGDDAFYIFFRLHHALYSRLQEAKQSASEKGKGLNDSYAIFLDLLHSYLANREKHEDELRTRFATWSGLIFSIERLINKLSKQLLAISMDEVDNKLLELFADEKLRESGTFVDEVYNGNASMIVKGCKLFRFECLLVPNTKGQNRLTISQINLGERNMRQYASRRC